MSYFIRAAQLHEHMTHAEVIFTIVDLGFARRQSVPVLPAAAQIKTSAAMQPMFLGSRSATAKAIPLAS